MTIVRRASAICLAGALTVSLSAQQVFRGGTDVVVLQVTATNAAGQLVGGLERDEFQVFEDGVRQDIGAFAADRQPLALSLLVDSSTSMDHALLIAQAAAARFVKGMGPEDVAQVIDFDSQVTVLQAYTKDGAALEAAIKRMTAAGSTSLYSALYQAMRTPEFRPGSDPGAPARRWAIVVLSDGEDTSSRHDYESVLDEARRSEYAVYAIGLRAKEDLPRGGFRSSEYALRALAQETGGRAYFVDDALQLGEIYEQIARELSSQYAIGYTSKNTARDGKWRRVEVRVTRPGTVARTRTGYFSRKGSG